MEFLTMLVYGVSIVIPAVAGFVAYLSYKDRLDSRFQSDLERIVGLSNREFKERCGLAYPVLLIAAFIPVVNTAITMLALSGVFKND